MVFPQCQQGLQRELAEELLPEFWTTHGVDELGKQAKRSKGKKRVQEINVWLQCYALYVAVRAVKAPKLVPELMAYQEYEGAAYDAAYRRQAAATGH